MNIRVYTLISLLATSTACMAEVEPDVGDLRAGQCRPEDNDPDQDVSFQDDIMPLFEKPFGSGGCGCHFPGGANPSGITFGGLDLSTYGAVMQGGNQSGDEHVVPGDPCASILLQKVSNAPPFGGRMPPNGPPFMSLSDRKLLHDWIAEGARDN